MELGFRGWDTLSHSAHGKKEVFTSLMPLPAIPTPLQELRLWPGVLPALVPWAGGSKPHPLASVSSWADCTLSTISAQNLSSRIILDHSTLPEVLDVKYDSFCNAKKVVSDEARGQCDNVKINDEVCSPVLGMPCSSQVPAAFPV